MPNEYVRLRRENDVKKDIHIRGISRSALDMIETRAKEIGWNRNQLIIHVLESFADGEMCYKTYNWQAIRSVEFLNLADRIEGVEDVLVEVARRLDERLPVTRKRDREEG